MRGWTVSAGSAIAVAALIGGGAFAVNTLGQPEPERQEDPAMTEPAQLLEVSDEEVTIQQAEPTASAEPEPVVESTTTEPTPVATPESEPVVASDPTPVKEEEPVVTQPVPVETEIAPAEPEPVIRPGVDPADVGMAPNEGREGLPPSPSAQ